MSAARRADLAYLTAIAFGILFIALGGPLARRLEMVHMNDFSGVWSGPATWLLGIDPYDATRYSDVAVSLGTKAPDALVYDYMPWVMFGMMPFALVPLEVAAWIWMFLGMGAATIALRALLRTFLPAMPLAHFALGLALFVGQPGFHAIVLGQWSPVLMAAVALVVLALRAKRPLLAAAPSLLFLAKPQVFVFTTLGLAYGALRRPAFRRYVVAAAILGMAVVAVTWIAAGDWFSAWFADIPGRRTARSAVLTSILNELIGPTGRAIAIALILAGAAVATRFDPGSDASLAAWLSLSSAGAIYSWSYDQLLLFVPLTIAAGVVARRDARLAQRFALAWAGVFLLVSPVLYAVAVLRHDETFSGLVPLAAFCSIVVLLWRDRSVAATSDERMMRAATA